MLSLESCPLTTTGACPCPHTDAVLLEISATQSETSISAISQSGAGIVSQYRPMRGQCDADLVVPAAGDEGGALQLAGVLLRQPPHPRHLPRYELPGPDCHPQASLGLLSETIVTVA